MHISSAESNCNHHRHYCYLASSSARPHSSSLWFATENFRTQVSATLRSVFESELQENIGLRDLLSLKLLSYFLIVLKLDVACSFWEPRGLKIIANKTFHISNRDSVVSFEYSSVNFTHVKCFVLFYLAGTCENHIKVVFCAFSRLFFFLLDN